MTELIFEKVLKKLKKVYNLLPKDDSLEEEGEGGAMAAPAGGDAGGTAAGGDMGAMAIGGVENGDAAALDGSEEPSTETPAAPKPEDVPPPKPPKPPRPPRAGVGVGALWPLYRWPFAVRSATATQQKKRKKTTKRKKAKK